MTVREAARPALLKESPGDYYHPYRGLPVEDLGFWCGKHSTDKTAFARRPSRCAPLSAVTVIAELDPIINLSRARPPALRPSSGEVLHFLLACAFALINCAIVLVPSEQHKQQSTFTVNLLNTLEKSPWRFDSPHKPTYPYLRNLSSQLPN